MIKVRITGDVLQTIITTGFEYNGLVRCISGVPQGAEFSHFEVGELETFYAIFKHDTSDIDQDILPTFEFLRNE